MDEAEIMNELERVRKYLAQIQGGSKLDEQRIAYAQMSIFEIEQKILMEVTRA